MKLLEVTITSGIDGRVFEPIYVVCSDYSKGIALASNTLIVRYRLPANAGRFFRAAIKEIAGEESMYGTLVIEKE